MTPIFELRKKYKEDFKEKHDVGLGFMSFFTKATVKALQEFPDLNSMIDGDQQIKYDFFFFFISVSGPKGLMVPVVRDAQKLTFSEIEKEIKRLAIRARDGEIKIRPVMYLALSYDHRIIDGKESVSFLRMIKENLEEPRRLFLAI